MTHETVFAEIDAAVAANELEQSEADEMKVLFTDLHTAVLVTYDREKLLLELAQRHKQLEDSLRGELTELQRQLTDKRRKISVIQKEVEDGTTANQEEEQRLRVLQFELEELLREQSDAEKELETRRNEYERRYHSILERLEERTAELKVEEERDKSSLEKERESEIAMQEEEKLLHSKISQQQEAVEVARRELLASHMRPQEIRASLQRMDNRVQALENRKKQQVTAKEKAVEEHTDMVLRIEELQRQFDKGTFDCTVAESKLIAMKESCTKLQARAQKTRNAIDRVMESKVIVETDISLENKAIKDYEQQKERFRAKFVTCRRKHEKLRRAIDKLRAEKPALQQLITSTVARISRTETEVEQNKAKIIDHLEDTEHLMAAALHEEMRAEKEVAAVDDIRSTHKQLEIQIQDAADQAKIVKSEVAKARARRENIVVNISNKAAELKEKKVQVALLEHESIEQWQAQRQITRALDHCRTEYDVIKMQRNKFATGAAHAAQECAELSERIELLKNELEILRNESESKSRQLAEEARVLEAATVTRDELRQEVNNASDSLSKLYADQAQLDRDIAFEQQTLGVLDKDMAELRERFVRATARRNRVGLQLVDRNDELAVLYEKQNVLQKVLGDAQQQLNGKEEQITAVQLELRELLTRIDAVQARAPSEREYETVTKQQQDLLSELETLKEKFQELSNKLETPAQVVNLDTDEDDRMKGDCSTDSEPSGRVVRHLSGYVPTVQEASTKAELLEERLLSKKEQLLQKELVIEEVGFINEQLRAKAADNHALTLQLAEKLNEYQGKVRKLTRAMMATVAELSFKQATALKLEHDCKLAQSELTAAKQRLHRGEPPTEQAAHEWARLQNESVRRRNAALRAQREARDIFEIGELPDTPAAAQAPTKAETRANAYIPTDDLRGLPRPFLGFALPFKPQVNGAHMRHFREPATFGDFEDDGAEKTRSTQ
ncbi:MAG: hypothetical protein MHM6MM_000291 [Cercozoa sp. M6MM]